MALKSRLSALGVGLVAASLALTACSSGKKTGGSDESGSASGGTLVVAKVFDLKSVDPGHMYELTGMIADKAMYDTLVTYEGGNVKEAVPLLADMTVSDDAKTYTFKIKDGRTFSSGNPVTADDVLFSLQRVQGMKGTPAFLLDGLSFEKADDSTVVVSSKEAAPGVPAIMANPAMGILDSKVVKENGGTTGTDDKAESWLNKNSAGSGPYTLSSMDVASQVTMELNPKYDGPADPTYDKVVMQNTPASTQKINVEGGQAQLALDLSASQTKSADKSKVTVAESASAQMIFLFANQNKSVSPVTASPEFAEAMRLGVDYKALLDMAGNGAVQATGVVPSILGGAVPENGAAKQDLDGAKKALKASGYKGEKIQLNYPSDISVNGVDFNQLAQKLQVQLKEIGINADLAPAPVATELDKYRNGKEQIGLWYYGPDYPDASSYTAYGPGELMGLRAGWAEGADDEVTKAATAANQTVGDSRDEGYVAFGEALNEGGPFVPLFQPGNNLLHANTLTNVDYNPIWTVDVASLGKK
ncbi:ABC transporter substrate-binding protein [Galactobacter sp.]|uniref:ABC transporter substrate-binding protein n=1 Tax=Galactobacter sp. TaxID=2676125 RepID=UPI0025BF2CDC|nr:ABC transporter substrate-binding protein [Galactobacter sp.]